MKPPHAHITQVRGENTDFKGTKKEGDTLIQAPSSNEELKISIKFNNKSASFLKLKKPFEELEKSKWDRVITIKDPLLIIISLVPLN